jgi:hypothetical protein
MNVDKISITTSTNSRKLVSISWDYDVRPSLLKIVIQPRDDQNLLLFLPRNKFCSVQYYDQHCDEDQQDERMTSAPEGRFFPIFNKRSNNNHRAVGIFSLMMLTKNINAKTTANGIINFHPVDDNKSCNACLPAAAGGGNAISEEHQTHLCPSQKELPANMTSSVVITNPESNSSSNCIKEDTMLQYDESLYKRIQALEQKKHERAKVEVCHECY